jgi:hypothetical protein
MAVPVRDQLDLLRADLDQDRDRRELAALRYEIIDGPRRVAERRRILEDPKLAVLAELGRVVAPVKYPELLASAAAYRKRRAATDHRKALVAAALLPGAADLSKPYSIRDRLVTGCGRL